MIIQNVKGGYDFLPNEQKIRNYINDILKETFIEYGYESIETPILCYYDILSDKYDENNDILKEIYKLKDQGNRSLGLRYDLTIPFVKFIALNKNKISFPFKRYEISKVFRDGPVKVGRDREFTQCDVDVVGITGQFIEAELLSLYVEAFKKLNIDIIIKYNSRNLMTGLIIESGVDESLVPSVTTILDKKDKLSKEELNNYKNNNEKIKIGLEEINNLDKYLKGINIDKYCKFDISLDRGQNYYTGNVFEVYERNGKITCAIGSGGRYDKIVGNFINDGNNYPTVGISFGLTPIYELLKNSDIFKSKSLIDIYIIPINTDIESLKLGNSLRNMGYNVLIEMNNKKIKKSMEFANKERIKYVIVLGEDEIKNKCFKIKNMFSGNEYEVNFNNLNKIKEIYE